MKKPNSTISVLKPLCSGIALALAAGLMAPSTALATDALSESSEISSMAPQSLLLDLERVGTQLIAVGERGHILLSANQGQSWEQVSAPVRVTLTSTHFVDAQVGWAVGHDGVILHTEDGGHSWRKQLDGNQANQLMLERTQQLLAATEQALESATPEEAEAQELELAVEEITYLYEDAQTFVKEGPSRPLLDLWFKDRNEGIAVGAFGLILHTADGGAHWSSWVEHIDNRTGYHLNGISQIGDQLYIAAEAGTLYRSSDWGQSWEKLDSPYQGSFFGVIGNAQGRIIAFGLRGNAFQSNDWGDSWEVIHTATDASLFGGTLLADGSAVLVGAEGVSVHIDADGKLINHTQTPQRLPLSKVIQSNNQALLTVGLRGIQPLAIVGGTH